MGTPLSGLDAQTRESLFASATAEGLTDLAEKFSGADLMRVALDDGRNFVLKRLPRGGDWLTRSTGGETRVFTLWSSGLLDDLAGVIDHTIVDCVEVADDKFVIMRDASADLIPSVAPVTRDTSSRLLAGLARLHGARPGAEPAGLCTVASRYAMFAPTFHEHDSGPGPHPLRELIVEGWNTFADLVPGAVVEAVYAVHRDPATLGHALDRFPRCLLHGDAKLENMGLAGDGLVLIDWGDLTGFGPREVDVAWYALKGSARIGQDPGTLFGDYESKAGTPLDRRALNLTCLGSLAQMGFRMANSATRGRPEPVAVGKAQLEWWMNRVRDILASSPY